jgi:hypothetical protein
MSARPMTAAFPPSGCAHCGLARDGHFQRWTDAAGWHKWEPPTKEAIRERLLERYETRRTTP